MNDTEGGLSEQEARSETMGSLTRLGKALREGDAAKSELRALWEAIDEVCPELSQTLYLRAKRIERDSTGAAHPAR